MSWRRRFAAPLRTNTGKTIATLADARAFMLQLGKKEPLRLNQNQWVYAFEHLEAAAKGGDIDAARQAFRNALVLSMLLDFSVDQ